DLKGFGIDPADPAWHFGRVPVPGLALRIAVHSEPRLAFGKPGHRSERDPTGFRFAVEGRKGITDKRHADKRRGDAVQRSSDLEKKVAARQGPRRGVL